MVIDLTGMEIANASLLDEGTAAAEAMFMQYSLRKNQQAKIILIGDFNDTPDSEAITETLKASKEMPQIDRQLFNPFAKMAEEKKGSYYYKGEFEMIDQMMLSKALLTNKPLQYVPNSATIHQAEGIVEKEGKFAGAPLRTYAGKKYLGGYSDHFPIYIKLQAR